VETRFGYHLIKVYENSARTAISYSNVRNRIGEILRKDKINEGIGLLADGLKEGAEIEMFLPE
jgi:hypothetical protein